MRFPPVFPDGWKDDLLRKADLEGSLRTLDGCDHFHASTMRGRLTSHLLRRDEARAHFREALRKSEGVPEDIPTLVRLFLLEVYRFENELLTESALGKDWSPEVPVPDLPGYLAKAYPAIHYAWYMRMHTEGLFQLNIAGEYERARDLFRICAESDATGADGHAFAYLYVACCEHMLGNHDEAERLMESSALAIHASDHLINQVHSSALLLAAHRVMEQDDKAEEWKAYLQSRPCPEVTRQSFLQRSEEIIEMSVKHGRLLLV